MLIAKIYFRKGTQAKSATGEDAQVKCEGNQVQTSLSFPSGVTQDVLNLTRNELWQYMWNVYQESLLVTQHPGCLLGVSYVGILCRAYTKIPDS